MNKYNKRETIRDSSFLSTFLGKDIDGKRKLTYRFKRWFVVIAIHLTFFLSFAIDIQVLEGTLNASRFLGFHLIDIFTSFELFLASYHLPINVIIGTSTIIFVYLLIGGRTYCSWVCPYGILSEIGEKIHDVLLEKKIIKERKFDNRVRYVFWFIFLFLSFTSGYLVFETFNVVGILSRFIAYGWSVGLVWVLAVLSIEILYSRRAWCKYVCPIGTTYGFLGWASTTKVQWDDSCDHCMVCFDVCFENQVLDFSKAKYDKQRVEKNIKTEYVINGDCTLCGRCIDVCHNDALKFDFRMKSII